MKSNCLFYALREWFGALRRGEETYFVIRRSRIPWGIFHTLHGRLDPATGQIAVTSYKPIDPRKQGPFFRGDVVQGDA